MERIHLSERAILEAARRHSHLGEGISRITFRCIRCLKDFCTQDKLIYQAGKEYKIWIVRYEDAILQVKVDFTVIPSVVDPDLVPMPYYWYAVPLGTFEEINQAPYAYTTQIGDLNYRLVCDSEGYQVLVEEWQLNREAVKVYVADIKGCDADDFKAVARMAGRHDKMMITYELTRKINKFQRETCYFDVINREIHGAAQPIVIPVGNNQKTIVWGPTKVRYTGGNLNFVFANPKIKRY